MESKNLQTKEKGAVGTPRKVQSVMPLVDIFENDDEILLHAEMPGVTKDAVKINIDNGNLSLFGMRKAGRDGAPSWEEFGDVEFQRAFAVPQNIDVAKVKAELKDGILCLHLPKSESAKPKTIEISGS
ncbi:Hsp20/alpha crystallin family protein [Desulfofustis glycolicus]|uniref:Molecular chaperone IbpA, HSP20 family n=1 Tax=Desulfofustis glycolicus DSM 9705 TaxID=1121409 RepID=A0A1M5YFE9_9BACT|nr:Hsp20/alpha crystallin family protein [Desulfofustis glycolicus]MCB2216917.1 Hsp20/alpha crystallin family protein [Desulfobulbaceae bacterium]SHI10243.1 Molecular chaperone IbpA, HSP20 family [Desulfofustis glycolicus DSM 9705]